MAAEVAAEAEAASGSLDMLAIMSSSRARKRTLANTDPQETELATFVAEPLADNSRIVLRKGFSSGNGGAPRHLAPCDDPVREWQR